MASGITTADSAEVPEISYQEMVARLRDPSLKIVDVLNAESYAHGHIPGAIHLPLADIPERAREILPDLKADLALYCYRPTCPASVQAGRLLISVGYEKVRHYHGGIEGWEAAGGPIERSAAPEMPAEPRGARQSKLRRSARMETMLLDLVENSSTMGLFLVWLAMVVGCGFLYWLDMLTLHRGLLDGGAPLSTGLGGLGSAIYFSFATATSVGYGDVVPVGMMRFVSVAEAVMALLIFGAVIAKFVSRRQDKLVGEIHEVSFEERLDRVQTNLHVVFCDLQELALISARPSPPPREMLDLRLESAVMVFVSELRTVHHLLYDPFRIPDEDVLKSILAGLSHSLQALDGILRTRPPQVRKVSAFDGSLTTLTRLALEICSECVPRAYAPALSGWMDRIHTTAESIASDSRPPQSV
jgi:rhodanese-related sulfurtransferase